MTDALFATVVTVSICASFVGIFTGLGGHTGREGIMTLTHLVTIVTAAMLAVGRFVQ